MATQGNRLDNARSHEAPTKPPVELKSGREGGQDDKTAEKGGESVAIVRRGTGPRTTRGKEQSRRNSLKHGIFAKAAVLEGESSAELDSLLEGLRDSCHPVGTLEDVLVEKLASLVWRDRRFLIAEGAEIRGGTQFVEYDEKQRQFIEAGEISEISSPGGLVTKIANPEILQRCLKLLADLRGAIEENGFDPETDKAILTTLYGDFEEDSREDTLLESYLFSSTAASVPDDVRQLGEFQSPEVYTKDFLEDLSNEIKRFEHYKKEQNSIESKRMKLKSLRLNVPDSLLRYSASLERAFDRTLSQLERAQRVRLGQPVTPRIDVNVSSS
jgi:hypothetical protein